MTMTTVTIVGLVVLAALIWLFLRMRSKDLIEEKMQEISEAVAKDERDRAGPTAPRQTPLSIADPARA